MSMVQWTWDMVADGKVLAITDPDLDHDFFKEDFIRMVEIGLWCTQSHPSPILVSFYETPTNTDINCRVSPQKAR